MTFHSSRMFRVTAATACVAAVSLTALGLPAASAATSHSPVAPAGATGGVGGAAAGHSAFARGRLVGAVHLQPARAADVRARLRDAGFDASRVAYDVDLYRLVYRTAGVDGR